MTENVIACHIKVCSTIRFRILWDTRYLKCYRSHSRSRRLQRSTYSPRRAVAV